MHGRLQEPYSICVDKLNRMDDCKEDGRGQSSSLLTPMQKMNCITDISSCIKQEVFEFWKGVAVDPRKLTLDAE